MGWHIDGEMNGLRDERKEKSSKGCISWKILLQRLECRTGALIYNVYHGSVRDFHTYKMEQHREVSRCSGADKNHHGGNFNILICLYFYAVNFIYCIPRCYLVLLHTVKVKKD